MEKALSGMNSLELKIRELELLQTQQLEELKQSATALADSINPAKILKNAMKTVIGSPGLRSTAIDTAISTGAGFLGKKLLFRHTGNIFQRVAGTAVQFLVSNFVRNKMPGIKENIEGHKNGNGVEK